MLSQRVSKAKQAVPFCKILARDVSGRVTSVLTPGSEGKQYRVILRRNGHITTECQCQTSGGDVVCQGNQKAVCYHSLAALIVAAEARDGQVSFCESKDKADNLAHTGRTVSRVTSHQCENAELWMAVKYAKVEIVPPTHPTLTPETNANANIDHRTISQSSHTNTILMNKDSHLTEQQRRDKVSLFGSQE